LDIISCCTHRRQPGYQTTLAALAISQNWLAFANLVPLPFMLACAVMMLKYMKGHHGHQAENERTIASPEAPGAGHVRG
jgi:DUF2933 family protein